MSRRDPDFVYPGERRPERPLPGRHWLVLLVLYACGGVVVTLLLAYLAGRY